MVRVAEDRTQALLRVENEARERLEKLAAKHLPRVEYDIHVVAANDATGAILREAQDLAADVIAIGAEGRRLLRSGSLGSVAEAVLERSPVPVFLVRH
jgi:nucleotide-binding universal stress UspA family protein